MRKALSNTMWKRKRDKIITLLTVLGTLAPFGVPAEVATWFQEQLPGVPLWIPSLLGWAVVVSRALLAKKALQ